MRFAMTFRSRDIFSVFPRRGEGAAVAFGAALASAACGASVAAVGFASAVFRSSAAFRSSSAFRAASRTSSLRIRPPTPVPESEPRSTPLSLASLRTIGVT